MNVEELREYCLSIGDDVEERLPFAKMKGGETVLVFYVCNHMFCYFNFETFDQVAVKGHPDDIVSIRENYEGIVNPSHMSAKHWMGLCPDKVGNDLMRKLIRDSYDIVKAKYTPKRTKKPSGKDG
ncbi:MAG: MmcQ/YjbR family DNA-binding protein [Prevotella sp.]|nr:MmcQ/YjbR family DNA-binding protein [Prevotella sp.]